MNKVEIDVIIGLIESLIKLVSIYSPGLAKNPAVVELEAAIKGLQALGL